MEVKRRKNAEQAKKDIVMQAKELFASKGYAATSMEDICEATGRSKGSIYYYFKSKEELFLHLIRLNLHDWRETWYEKKKGYTSSTDQLYAMAEHFVEDFENPLMKTVDEFINGQVISEEVLQEMITLTQSQYHLYEELLQEGMERGEFQRENANDLMYILNGLLGGLGTLYYEKDMTEMKRLYKKAIDILLLGISVRKD